MKLKLAGSVALLLAALTALTSAPHLASSAASDPPPAAIQTTGIDLHDGTVAKFGSTYYLYGSIYGCGFHWGQANTPWCGFGVSTAANLNGPWSTPTVLFSPSSLSPYTGTSWSTVCGKTGAGCFNPRMVQRSWGPADNVNILWFNAPSDFFNFSANAYYVMGCNSPTGPCGDGAGAPYGSTRKPPMYVCSGVGDFSIVVTTTAATMVCTMGNGSLAMEQIDTWGTTGTGIGTTNLAGLTNVESPGVFHDAASHTWILTYSDPNCGYCAGTGTGYATAANLLGPWTAPQNTGYAAPVTGRRTISANSCGGQPRTVFTVDSQPYQLIDLWGKWNNDASNQTDAGLLFAPLVYTPQASTAGRTLPAQFVPWACT